MIRIEQPEQKALVLLLFFLLISLVGLPAEGMELPYPSISSLLPSDTSLKQLHEDIAYYTIQESAQAPLPPLGLYQYSSREGDDLFGLASRFNIPYETIATLNRISAPGDLLPGTLILVPNQPGLFLPEIPRTELETFIQTWREISEESRIDLILYTPRGIENFIYIQKQRFHSMERAFFLGILFHNPIPSSRLTSRFGNRNSPITGEYHFHNGIDLAAEMGTPVIPAREGVVIALGSDAVFGNYILIRHPGGWETFYGHLKKIFVRLNENVTSSIIIGEVGDTGLSTGPHLHFELRRNGESTNPESLLPGIH